MAPNTIYRIRSERRRKTDAEVNDDLKQDSNERNDVVRAATAGEVQLLEGPGELPNDFNRLLEHRFNTCRRCIVRVNIV